MPFRWNQAGCFPNEGIGALDVLRDILPPHPDAADFAFITSCVRNAEDVLVVHLVRIALYSEVTDIL